MTEQPVVVMNVSGEITDDQLAELERRFLAAWNDPKEWRKCRRRDLRRNLPRRTRLRLAGKMAITRTGIWLVDRGYFGAAKRLWRITGQW